MSTDPTDTQILVRPEVAAFVEDVRRRLADLDDETREELTGGLEADLSDQLADGTPLGDPGAYAAELRAAAGLPDPQRRALPRLPDLRAPGELIDRTRARFLTIVERPWIAPIWETVAALRPAWWVARAWIAVTLVDVFTGPWEPMSLIPSLGHDVIGSSMLAVAVVVSTLIGTGKVWPGSGPDRGTASRVTLLALNAGALAAPTFFWFPLPGYLIGEPDTPDETYYQGYQDGSRTERGRTGLRNDGHPVRNVFAYDAAGNAIERVQLFDEDGDPIEIDPEDTVTGRGAERTVGCPARNGEVAVHNVFPLDQLLLRRGTCAGVVEPDASRPDHPLASVPPLTAVRSPHDRPADPQRAPRPDRRS